MFTINTENLGNALDYASVGGGKGYVLLVDPTIRELGDGRTMQLASVCSSDGDRIGTANIEVRTKDMKKPEIFYISATLKQAVASLAPVADTIFVTPMDSCLKLADESGKSVIKVPLREKEAILEIPASKEDIVMLQMKRENFVRAVRIGGCVAVPTQTALSDAIGIKIDAENKEMKIMSFRNEMSSIATVQIDQVASQGVGDQPSQVVDVWHLVNYQFIQSLLPRLTGEVVEIALNKKYMQIMSLSASYASKKMTGQMPGSIERILSDEGYDYIGVVKNKNFQVGLNIVTVGVDENKVIVETDDNGALKISSFNLANKTAISQENHQGVMPKRAFIVDLLKQLLKVCGEDVQYCGKSDGKESMLLFLQGKEHNVGYRSCIASCNMQKK